MVAGAAIGAAGVPVLAGVPAGAATSAAGADAAEDPVAAGPDPLAGAPTGGVFTVAAGTGRVASAGAALDAVVPAAGGGALLAGVAVRPLAADSGPGSPPRVAAPAAGEDAVVTGMAAAPDPATVAAAGLEPATGTSGMNTAYPRVPGGSSTGIAHAGWPSGHRMAPGASSPAGMASRYGGMLPPFGSSVDDRGAGGSVTALSLLRVEHTVRPTHPARRPAVEADRLSRAFARPLATPRSGRSPA
ncbi:hypothetical protein GA0074692_5336 [Micromonospora pallida]|uniref:Uncharacterized protein n=1 Tax=Micromonospora pallida TaxID=145854 RepID=A0A1C6TC25_9ACTN|nr:hypothetical protein GA0074692_5336 [Micromonospora pallida]